MPIVLYKMDGSLPSRAVNMVVEMLGLKVEARTVNTITGENFKPEYIEKNPLRTIPLIEEGDFKLADSHAIITYLVSKYGADQRAHLYPSDLRIRATIEQRMYFDCTILFPSFRAVMVSMFRDKTPGPTAVQVAGIEEAYGVIEKYLQTTPYLAADHVTLADVSCVASVSTLDIIVPINEKYTKLHEWFNRIKEQDWYQKGNAPGLAMIEGFIKSVQNKA